MKGLKGLFLFLFIYLFAFSLFGANIYVPSLELITRGIMTDGLFSLSTDGEMNMIIHGGDKFGGKLVLGFASNDLEDEIQAGTLEGLAFKSAAVAVKNLFDTPLTISYFIGEKDFLCSGTGFSELFGAEPIITHYSGFMYFTDGVNYNGIHTINGTGLQLSLLPILNMFSASAYFYQDASIRDASDPANPVVIPGKYSYDLRALLNFPNIKLEFFAGSSYHMSTYGYYRAGILFNAYTPAGGFMMQLGVPRWDPAVDTLGINLFYLLFEVNIQLGIVRIVPTVFMHPGFYAQIPTGEEGIMDVNLNFQIGDIQKHLVSGGLETNISFEEAAVEGLTVKVAPYLKLLSPGVEWQFKVNTKVFASPYPAVEEMFEGFVGIKAVF